MVLLFRSGDKGEAGWAMPKVHHHFKKPVTPPVNININSSAANSAVLSYLSTTYSDSSYKLTSNVPGVNVTDNTGQFNISGLTPGKSYTFNINVKSKRNNSEATTSVTYVTPPVAPTITNVTLSGNTSVIISFTSSNGADTTYSVSSNPSTTIINGPSPITFTNLELGKTYIFTVTASTTSGSSSSVSNAITIPSPPILYVTDGTIDSSWNYVSGTVLKNTSLNSTLRSGSNGCWTFNSGCTARIDLTKFGVTSILNKTISFDVKCPYYAGQGYNYSRVTFYFGGSNTSNGCSYYLPTGNLSPYIGPNTRDWSVVPTRTFAAPYVIPNSYCVADIWFKMNLTIDNNGIVYIGRNDCYYYSVDLSAKLVGTLIGFNAYSTYYVDNFKIESMGNPPTFPILYSVNNGDLTGWVDKITTNATLESVLYYPYGKNTGCWSFANGPTTRAHNPNLATSYNITSFLNKTIEFDFCPHGAQNSFFFGGNATNNGVSITLARDHSFANGIAPNTTYTSISYPSTSYGPLSAGNGSWIRIKVTIESNGLVTMYGMGTLLASVNMLQYLTGTFIGFIVQPNGPTRGDGGCSVDNFTIFDGVH